MSLATFDFTDRVRPVVELGLGDVRVISPGAAWDVGHWDTAGDVWAGTEPTWRDVSCDTSSFDCVYGRQRTMERFAVGVGRVVVDNSTGWADPAHSPDLTDLTVRPGRSIRMGVVHAVYGVRWLFRGFVDTVTPTYAPTGDDMVELTCIDALGEVNRAKTAALPAPVGGSESVTARITRLLNHAQWPLVQRDLWPGADTLIADDLGGQLADLLGQAADSGGGSVFGDMEGRIAFRPRDWQTFLPGTPPDGTIGNVAPGDVCPVEWERPFARADITTRAIVGRDTATAVYLDDNAGQLLYGIEPFERVDLLTESTTTLNTLARRILRTRSAATAPRVRSVTLDARTADNALDLMTTVDVYKPSRYRCRLELDRGTVFDDEYFATGVAHQVTRSEWSLNLNLDVAAPYIATGGRWDGSYWDQATWADAAALLEGAAP